jgi:arabinoxylan arabinofuranohydrolase
VRSAQFSSFPACIGSPLHGLRRSRQLLALALLAPACLLSTQEARADNPIIQNVYTADPAPMVHGDTVYLCTSHDEDVTVDDFFTMNDWLVYSSKDMVNWTDHGSPLRYQTFSWATGKAWAPHCIHRNGKFYFYVPVSDSIGVAVSDSPTGPFEDAIGSPLLSNYQYIDPSVFIDDDGQAYLYFGNPRLWYVKLNEDMISYSGQVEQIPMEVASFGQRNGVPERPTLYEEGPWFYKRNDLYHMVFAMGPLPEQIGYSTSPGPTGPWSYQGMIMNNESGHAFTNHAGVIDFKGHSYFFYHTQELPGGGGFKRSVAVERFDYNTDGSFPTIRKTSAGVTESAAPLNPYERVEGETIAWAPGIEVEDKTGGGRFVAEIQNGDSIKVKSVNFLTGALSFAASVASDGAGGSIELHVGSATGMLLGTCMVSATGGWQEWENVTCDVSAEVTGIQDLYLVFKGGSGALFNLDYWQFTPKDPLPGSGGAGGMAGSGGMGGASGGTSSGGAAGVGGVGGGVSGGAAGTANVAGTSTGGASGMGGTVSGSGGAAGRATGGTGAAAGGAAAQGGALPSAGKSGAAGGPSTPNAPDDSGCACTTHGRSAHGPHWVFAMLSLIGFAGLRRRSGARSRTSTR